MKIVKITYQHRRDFSAEMQCEFCGSTKTLTSGYDDHYYHSEIIPNMVCKDCEKSTVSGGGSISKFETKYPEGFQV